MGVNLKDLIKTQTIDLKDLSGKKIGIDAYNWAYQFLSIIRLQTGEPLTDSKGRITSHLTGIFNRTINLMKENIFPCYVWDGEPPEFKSSTIELRKQRKEEARLNLKRAKTPEEVRKYSQQTSQLTKEMIADAEKLLDAMGIPSVQAPSEGEAQVTHMVKNGDLWACASQDWDALLFGAERLVRNLSITGKRKLPRKQDYIFINPELIHLKEVLKELDISQEQLIILAMLVGTDYCPGIMGYGPKKSYALVKEAKTLDNVLAKVKWDFNVPAEKILDWFKHPKVTDNYKMQWKPIDHEKVLKHMVDEHEFSQERIQNQLDSLQQSQHKKGQTGLSKFF
jgi:flap endonuclease-1